MGTPSRSTATQHWILLLLCLGVSHGWIVPGAASQRARYNRPTSLLHASQTSSIPPAEEGTELPANLKRKIRAKRPFLGHIVPKGNRPRVKGGSAAPILRAQGKGSDFTKSQLRIAAGTARGRKLESPNVFLRPMMGKVKEAVFSTLTAVGVYDKTCRHLDIFAGSGNVGLESLSRGATECKFIDLSPDCCACIQRNLDITGLGPGIVQCSDAILALQQESNTKYQVVTICPPYEEVVYADLLEAAVGSPSVMEDTIIVVEYPVELLGDIPHVLSAGQHTAIGIRNRRYGRTVIAIYIIDPTGKLDADSRPEEFVQV